MLPSDRNHIIGRERSTVMVFLWTILTCGLYNDYFIYMATTEINQFLDEHEMNPRMELLYCSLTCGLWKIVWDYKIGKRIQKMQILSQRLPHDHSIVYVTLNLCGLGVMNSILQQNDLNCIWKAMRRQKENTFNLYGPNNQSDI